MESRVPEGEYKEVDFGYCRRLAASRRSQGPQAVSAKKAVTNQRPDIVIWSPSSRQAILVELTVSWEERIEEVY